MAQKADGIIPPYGQCGGLYPVFTSSSWNWTVSFDSDSEPLPSFGTSVAVQGDAVTFDSASGVFQSGSTSGTAQVTISSRQFTKAVPVRVVSITDVVSGEVRLVGARVTGRVGPAGPD